MTETVWPTKPEIFLFGPLQKKKKIHQPLILSWVSKVEWEFASWIRKVRKPGGKSCMGKGQHREIVWIVWGTATGQVLLEPAM